MKKLLSVLLTVALLCACVPLGAIPVAAATSGTTGDCTWTLDGTHLTISGNGAMGNHYTQDRPWDDTITSVTIEDGVTEIGWCAFFGCSSLKEVAIADSVTEIGLWAFMNCDSLTEIVIPAGVVHIGERVFVGCDLLVSIIVKEDNQAFSSEDGVLFDKEKTTLLWYPQEKTGAYTIPDGVATIAWEAFSGSEMLTSVTIPGSVTKIDEDAFWACTDLTDVYYGGTEADRERLIIEYGNDPLLNATWHYNYAPEGEVAPGDANGDGKVNVRDLGVMQQYLNGWDVTLIESACDVNGDGKINVRDMGLLQQYLNGWDVDLK